MTNIEERFKKAEVEKPAPNVNKIQIPTFEKSADSDEVSLLTNLLLESNFVLVALCIENC